MAVYTYLYSKLFQKCISGPDCSKLTTSLVNISLKFHTMISQIRQNFFAEKA